MEKNNADRIQSISLEEFTRLLAKGELPITGAPKCTKRRDLTILLCIACWMIGSYFAVA